VSGTVKEACEVLTFKMAVVNVVPPPVVEGVREKVPDARLFADNCQ
jgi:hypothetical protein